MRLLPTFSMVVPLAAALALLAACNATDKDGQQAAANPSAASAPAPVVDDADITMRYSCDADTSVVILRGERARASLPDGNTVDMGKVSGSTPPVFSGAGLYFAIGDSQAHLSQEDGSELACQPQ